MPPTKPVVFVPGFPGTHLQESSSSGRRLFLNVPALVSPTARAALLPRLLGPDPPDRDDEVVAGDPIGAALSFLFFDLAKQADSLYDLLRRLGYRVTGDLLRPVGWDWRRPVDAARTHAAVADAISGLHSRHDRPVVVIAHSAGGLVVRSLFEADPALTDKVERLIAFGVPWAGTLRPLDFLTAQKGFGPLTEEETQRVVAHAWTAYDLLPPDPVKSPAVSPLRLIVDQSAGGTPVGPLVERRWFPAAFRAEMETRAERADARFGTRAPTLDLGGRSLPVTNVVGFGTRTTLRGELGVGSAVALASEIDDLGLDDGDGTVPRRSAAWLTGPEVTTFHVPIGLQPHPFGNLRREHSVLWRNQGGVELLHHLLGDAPAPVFVYASADADDAVDTGNSLPLVRVRVVAMDDQGTALPGLRVTLDGPSQLPVERSVGARHLVRVPRSLGSEVVGGKRRLPLRIHWREGRGERSQRRVLVVNR